MAEEIIDVDDQGEEPTDLDKQIAAMEKRSQAEHALTRLLADPDISAVLAAKQRGQDPRTVFGQQQQQQAPPDEEQIPENLDEMSNSELVKYLQKSMVSVVKGSFTELTNPLKQQLEQITGHLAQREQKDVATTIKQMQAKYKDFEEMRPVMAEINQTTKGLNLEDLYVLARARKGAPVWPDGKQRQLQSERPNQPVRPPQKPSRRGRDDDDTREDRRPKRTGRAGFDDILSQALEKKEFDDIEPDDLD